jgi:FKBP-type peptidyl-prolyl cis-trans isomerase 2
MTLLAGLGFLLVQQLVAEAPRVVDGASVTVLYEINVPGEEGVEIRDVVRFVQGEHRTLPGLEQVVKDMKAGDERKIDLAPEAGFGSYDETKKITVPRSQLPEETKEGDVLEDRAGKPATVTQLSDNSAVMDYNHPLAGKPLSVRITVLGVEDLP